MFAPERKGIWEGSWIFSQVGVVATEAGSSYLEQEHEYERGLQRQKGSSETGNYGLTQFESLFSSALLFNCLGHSHLQKKIFYVAILHRRLP